LNTAISIINRIWSKQMNAKHSTNSGKTPVVDRDPSSI